MMKNKKTNNEMSAFIKTFAIAFAAVLIIVTPAVAFMGKVLDATPGDDDGPVLAEEVKFGELIHPDSPFFDAFTNTKRVNILAMGVERNNLTDTIILASFDIENKFLDIISIPRDTYYYAGPGYNDKAHHKINAQYRGNPINSAVAVSEILMNMPINYYALLSYEGVEKIIDEIGGVPMNVPFHMRYSDPYDKPPLYIDIPKGEQVLNGSQGVKLLRFRQANEDSGFQGYPDADLGRIKTQQEFIKNAIKKSLGLNLPNIVKVAFDNIESDVSIGTALNLASKIIGIEPENVRTYQIPLKGSDYRPDMQGIADMLTEIYSMGPVVLEDEAE